MIVRCVERPYQPDFVPCGRTYDDEFCWTICPHGPIWARPDAYCPKHDLVDCPFDKEVRPPCAVWSALVAFARSLWNRSLWLDAWYDLWHPKRHGR